MLIILGFLYLFDLNSCQLGGLDRGDDGQLGHDPLRDWGRALVLAP